MSIGFTPVDLGPGVLAGFTDRRGGVSRGPWAGLDLGTAVGDDPDDVATNRRLLAERVGAVVTFATQVHGARVVTVDRPAGSRGGPRAGAPTSPDDDGAGVGEADALVTATPGVAVGVYVADCLPVLLADAGAGVVAAAHAGRPGLLAGVVEAAVDAAVAAGARPDHLVAALGPCIAGRSYEVPEQMRADVARRVPAAASTTAWGTPAVDLRAGAEAVLRSRGVQILHRDDRDTFTDPDLYSHRRATTAPDPVAGARTGRLAGVVRLLPR
ncbi:peptidoglycan editing factor PgeF [Cellulomonas oligotrophica]|uniref:Purine nucleoside phosphorylase n=1 Tax=Cellulomonas oligotrophica TaxID=931536 RepID=A0A7Y9JW36_9CELL|nr:peptidoglycan editing factor PgeF [Cellulomonas oligotrophica]NYD84456.1 hypothetical protein [Cellulomonas oligotrophica]GIG33902.1 laccase domain protein [Cellulomonas oligotrophica]